MRSTRRAVQRAVDLDDEWRGLCFHALVMGQKVKDGAVTPQELARIIRRRDRTRDRLAAACVAAGIQF